jgi:hypothetical protein
MHGESLTERARADYARARRIICRGGTQLAARFNRRLHQLADWMVWIPDVLGEVFTTGDVFIIDSLPLPVCRRVRARRCRKVRGRECCG